MTAAAPEHAFHIAAAQICEKHSADFVPLRLGLAFREGDFTVHEGRLSKHLRAENKALISSVFTNGLDVRIPTGEPVDIFEHARTGERWS